MSYLQNRNKKRKNILRIIFVLITLFFVIYFRVSIFSFLSKASNFVFYPILKFGNNISQTISDKKILFISKQNLLNENDSLKNELEILKNESLNYNVILDDNLKLKEILARKKENENMILGTIVSKLGQYFFGTYTIDVGSSDGIKVGDLVFALGNIPIGKVKEVFDHSAKVVLFSKSGEKTEAVISKYDIFVELVGRGGGNFEIILPRDLEIEKGQELLLSNIKPHLIAKVVDIISDPRDSYKKVLLTSPINIQELKFVQVGISR